MKSLNDENKKEIAKLLDYLWRRMTDAQCLMIIDMDGNILDSKTSTSFQSEYDIKWQQKIAKKISLRFPMANFYKDLGGLETTVNMFKKHVVISRMLNSNKILIVIIKKNPSSIAFSLSAISDIENWPSVM